MNAKIRVSPRPIEKEIPLRSSYYPSERESYLASNAMGGWMTAYEFDGEKYKSASKHQKEWGNKIISEFDLKGNEIVLDLGCGDGVLTEQLSSLVPNGKVVGLDSSQGMIETAKKNKRANLHFILMDIKEIDFKEEFDLIFSNATLHWIKDHQKLLQKVFAGLKIDGVIRFNFAGDGNCSNFFRVVKEVMKDRRFEEYFKDYDWPWYMPEIGKYRELVRQSNFQEVRVWEENADRHFATSEEMVKWIDQPSIVPFLRFIPEEEKKIFRDTVVDRMIKETIQPAGTCFETFRRINVFARKSLV